MRHPLIGDQRHLEAAPSRDSREDVDAMRTTILESGGGENRPPQDHGFMYAISMTDPDGNILEFMSASNIAEEVIKEARSRMRTTDRTSHWPHA